MSQNNRFGRKESGNWRDLAAGTLILTGVIDIAAIKARFEALEPVLDERERRLFAAGEARAAGHGGVVVASRETGIARSTIDRGLADLLSGVVMFSTRIRRQGGGGKSATECSLVFWKP
jgi:hypothetical protein